MAKRVWVPTHKWHDYGFEGKCTLVAQAIEQQGVQPNRPDAWEWNEQEADGEGRTWIALEPVFD